MYDYIKGTLVFVNSSQATLDVQGIGYKIHLPSHLFLKLPQIGKEIQLYVSFVVREFSHAFYGFLSTSDRDLFDTLMNISGVGPKLALSIIGHLSLAELHSAVINQNFALLCKVPGVGKKTAERLIMELKDKLTDLFTSGFSEVPASLKLDPKDQKIQDAMSALIHLGYTQMIAQRAIQKSLQDMPETISLADLITLSLKHV